MTAIQITYLICLIISAVITIIGFCLNFIMKKKRNRVLVLQSAESQTVWEFTKKNFWIFLALFFLVMTVTFTSLLIASI
jgi:hypothetical protein